MKIVITYEKEDIERLLVQDARRQIPNANIISINMDLKSLKIEVDTNNVTSNLLTQEDLDNLLKD